MSSVGRALAGFVEGGAKGALDYDANVKKEASVTRRDNAIALREKAMAKYKQEGAMALNEADIKSRESIETDKASADQINKQNAFTERENVRIDAEKKIDSGYRDRTTGAVINAGQLSDATPEQLKGFETPKQVAARDARATAAVKKLEEDNKNKRERIKKELKNVATQKDVQQTHKYLRESFFFKGGETYEQELSLTKKYMRDNGSTGKAVEDAEGIGAPKSTPAQIAAEVAKKLAAATKGKKEDTKLKSYHKPFVPENNGSVPLNYKPGGTTPGALEVPGDSTPWEETRLGKAEAIVKSIPGGIKDAERTNLEALENLEKKRTRGSSIPGVGTFKR